MVGRAPNRCQGRGATSVACNASWRHDDWNAACPSKLANCRDRVRRKKRRLLDLHHLGDWHALPSLTFASDRPWLYNKRGGYQPLRRPPKIAAKKRGTADAAP